MKFVNMYYILKLSIAWYLVYMLQDVCGKQCIGNGPCSCTFDDGSGIIDITSLSSATIGQPRFKDEISTGDAYSYSYNPCQSFSEGACSNVASCQISQDGLLQFPIGEQASATWSYDGANVQVFYSKTTDVLRQTFVTLRCDPAATTPNIIVAGEQAIAEFHMTVTTECACADGCAADVPIITVEYGVSTGTILDILFLVGGFMYIAGGMTYMKMRKQAVGVEMIPNRTFWTALPGLIKDGFVFVVSKFKQKKTNYDQI